MPRRIITFLDNAYYHIFNRGIENLKLFQDDQDISAFQNSLAYYLVPFHEKPVDILARTGLTFNNSFNERVTLFAYALLPNSFHLLIHQADHNAIVKFMQRVGTAYSMYYNKKYTRRGTIFEGRFKTKHIDTDDYLLESTKYLHRLGLSVISHQSSISAPSINPEASQSQDWVAPAANPGIKTGEGLNTSTPEQNGHMAGDSTSDNETMKQSNNEGEASASPLSSLRFILKSAQNPEAFNGSRDQSAESSPAKDPGMAASASTAASSPVTSYQRYLDQTTPGFSPIAYIDQATNPTKALQHLGIIHPGMSYKDYVESSDNVDWYKGLLSWLQ